MRKSQPSLEQQSRAGGAIRCHGDRRVRGEQQRLVADIARRYLQPTSTMRGAGGVAAMAARQEAGLHAIAVCLPRKRDRDRRLAGTANCEIADAKHRQHRPFRAAR